jgi:hypothetical protein
MAPSRFIQQGQSRDNGARKEGFQVESRCRRNAPFLPTLFSGSISLATEPAAQKSSLTRFQAGYRLQAQI